MTPHSANENAAKVLPGWVLIVDDDAPIRTILREFLAESGLEAVAAEGGKQALALLDERPTEPLVAFVDVLMPGMDGLTLARRMRSRFKHGKIVIVSGHLSDLSWWPEDLREVEFLAKPFRQADVLEKVEAARRARGV